MRRVWVVSAHTVQNFLLDNMQVLHKYRIEMSAYAYADASTPLSSQRCSCAGFGLYLRRNSYETSEYAYASASGAVYDLRSLLTCRGWFVSVHTAQDLLSDHIQGLHKFSS